MWSWQFAWSSKDCVILRTWEDFKWWCEEISWLPYDLVVYVHNLSYEWQFIKSQLDFKSDNVFIVRNRKILHCQWANIHFKCSYLLSNMSLADWGKKYGIERRKAEGYLDYCKIRYPSTPMTRKEYIYGVNDVCGLVECLEAEMAANDLALNRLPLTSTGYVRRSFKGVLRKERKQWKKKPESYEGIRRLRLAFRGGDTHAHRAYSGAIQEQVRSVDRGSSYPANLYYEKYPSGAFWPVKGGNIAILRRWSKAGVPWLACIRMEDIRLRDWGEGFPYLPFAKLTDFENCVKDNGRILAADMAEIWITEPELEIIESQYRIGRISCPEVWRADKYEYLPRAMRDHILYMFEQKTDLKGRKGMDTLYAKYKNMINSIYGMTVQNPLQDSFVYGEYEKEIFIEEESLEISFTNFMQNQYWLPYSIGVWCTAYARKALWAARNKIVASGGIPIYQDTDSVKYIVPLGTIFELNLDERPIAEKVGAADRKGNMHFMGDWETEETADRFVTWGAKKYAAEIDGQLKITVAGVPKRKGAKELERKGGLEAFKPGFVWNESNKMRLVYNNSKIPWFYLNAQGERIALTSNIYMEETSYQLAITNEYLQAIYDGKEYAKKLDFSCNPEQIVI